MKNNKYSSKDSTDKKKGFYTALYACMGLLMIFGVTISVYNFNNAKQEPLEKVAQVEAEKIEEVSKSKVSSYIDPSEKLNEQTNEKEVVDSSTEKVTQQETPITQESKTKEEKVVTQESKVDEKPVVKAETKVKEEKVVEKKEETKVTTKEENITPQKEVVETITPQPEKVAEVAEVETQEINVLADDGDLVFEDDVATTNEETQTVFNAYVHTDKMSWPVIGEELVPFSMNHTIYDKTLDQFKTSDSLCIGAPVGTQVKSTFDGLVLSITDSPEEGKTVVIDNGNGYVTTYSQLQENVLVKEGDVVKMGQVLGGVGNPSKYKVLLGSHLNLRVSLDNQFVDPKELLVK